MSLEKFANTTGDNVLKLMSGYARIEAAKRGNFENGAATQFVATHTPTVEYQNQGPPASPQVVPKTQKTYAGDEAKNGFVINKKTLMIGGGLLVVVALGAIALNG